MKRLSQNYDSPKQFCVQDILVQKCPNYFFPNCPRLFNHIQFVFLFFQIVQKQDYFFTRSKIFHRKSKIIFSTRSKNFFSKVVQDYFFFFTRSKKKFCKGSPKFVRIRYLMLFSHLRLLDNVSSDMNMRGVYSCYTQDRSFTTFRPDPHSGHWDDFGLLG